MDAIKLVTMNIFLVILFCSFANGATVYGNIYDLSLEKVTGARVEVNTTPQQYLISKDGTYSFDIPTGFYAIKAELRNDGVSASESRDVLIISDGKYVMDLILFPNFEEEDDISQDMEIGLPETEKNNYFAIALISTLVIIAVLIFLFFKLISNKKIRAKEGEKEVMTQGINEGIEKKDLDDIINIIKKEGGRATQKDIRKEIPLSEAKISLMIAELEHKGIIEKIKKGRGNILILKQK
jgi:uncharacterized membrane protein